MHSLLRFIIKTDQKFCTADNTQFSPDPHSQLGPHKSFCWRRWPARAKSLWDLGPASGIDIS